MLGPLITAAGVGVAVAAGYQSMAPTGQWYGRTFNGLRTGSKYIALSYDDGPNDPYTSRLLDVLTKHDVKATFFVIGRFVQRRPDIVRELAGQGHVIGNHTFDHPLLTLKSCASIRTEIENCQRAVHDAIGEQPVFFRPPFGGRRPAVLRVACRLGLKPIMWNVTGYDWNAPAADYIERKVMKQVRGGDVILLHDGGHKDFGADRSSTIVASDKVISRCKSEGYEFVTIPQMMKIALAST